MVFLLDLCLCNTVTERRVSASIQQQVVRQLANAGPQYGQAVTVAKAEDDTVIGQFGNRQGGIDICKFEIAQVDAVQVVLEVGDRVMITTFSKEEHIRIPPACQAVVALLSVELVAAPVAIQAVITVAASQRVAAAVATQDVIAPVSRFRRTMSLTNLIDTRNCRAVAVWVWPSSTMATARARRALGCGLPIIIP